LAQVALVRRAQEQIQAMFDQLHLGCYVRCIKEVNYCIVGNIYEVVGWHSPGGEIVGLVNRNQRGVIAIKLGPEKTNSQTGYWNLREDTLELVPGVSLRLMHSKQMAEKLSSMKELHDVKLIAGEVTLTAPGILLSAASTVFHRMLATQMREGMDRTVVLQGTSPDAATAVLHFILHGCLKVDPKELPNVAILADQYELLLLFSATVNQMLVAVTEDTIASFVKTLAMFQHSEEATKAYAQLTKTLRKDDKLFNAFMQDVVAGPDWKKRRLE